MKGMHHESQITVSATDMRVNFQREQPSKHENSATIWLIFVTFCNNNTGKPHNPALVQEVEHSNAAELIME